MLVILVVSDATGETAERVVRSRTCFESVGTASKQFTIESSGIERSLTGERRRVRPEKGGTGLPSGPRPLGGP